MAIHKFVLPSVQNSMDPMALLSRALERQEDLAFLRSIWACANLPVHSPTLTPSMSHSSGPAFVQNTLPLNTSRVTQLSKPTAHSSWEHDSCLAFPMPRHSCPTRAKQGRRLSSLCSRNHSNETSMPGKSGAREKWNKMYYVSSLRTAISQTFHPLLQNRSMFPLQLRDCFSLCVVLDNHLAWSPAC